MSPGKAFESVTLFSDRSAQMISCVLPSIARCSFRQTRRRSLRCFLTFHSPSPKTFSPVESITRCAISPRVGALKLTLTDLASLLTTGVIRTTQRNAHQGKNGINKTLCSPHGEQEYTFNHQDCCDGEVRITLRSSPG